MAMNKQLELEMGNVTWRSIIKVFTNVYEIIYMLKS